MNTTFIAPKGRSFPLRAINFTDQLDLIWQTLLGQVLLELLIINGFHSKLTTFAKELESLVTPCVRIVVASN